MIARTDAWRIAVTSDCKNWTNCATDCLRGLKLQAIARLDAWIAKNDLYWKLTKRYNGRADYWVNYVEQKIVNPQKRDESPVWESSRVE